MEHKIQELLEKSKTEEVSGNIQNALIQAEQALQLAQDFAEIAPGHAFRRRIADLDILVRRLPVESRSVLRAV
ncbi:MAG: hypothetical protein HGA86_00835, partial [Anaerolineaceae bacterium]|nr:hypothetical protein [Anaerolineaceae bacterium]